MSVTVGSLSEFSLPETFQFLDQGKKTGLLTLNFGNQSYYIWFRQGRIVAMAKQLDDQGLASLIVKRGWLESSYLSKLLKTYSGSQPLGLYLKAQKMLEADQLEMLFTSQVLQPTAQLFRIKEGRFEFESDIILPLLEMTGLSLAGGEVALAALRSLLDWSALEDKLPDVTSGLIRLRSDCSHLRLYKTEVKVFHLCNKYIPITNIASQIDLSVEKVQQIAFRLMLVGLIEESPLVAENPQKEKIEENFLEFEEELGVIPVSPLPPIADNQPKIKAEKMSGSFLKNLVGFLRSKT